MPRQDTITPPDPRTVGVRTTLAGTVASFQTAPDQTFKQPNRQTATQPDSSSALLKRALQSEHFLREDDAVLQARAFPLDQRS
jgi:hypothetical protein